MKKVIRKRKKAFTLVELLIVVIVIGVLAAVAIPKFNNIIESRKTTEAESLLTAVRTEQERRCTFEKPYAGTFEKVGDIIAFNTANSSSTTTETGNYTYQLKEQGIEAKSKSKDYSLNMLSYKDGRLCCSGAYCSSLNKSYPSCDGLNVEYETKCAAPACELDPTSCACNPNQCKCGPYAAANPCECNRQCNPGQSKSKPCASGCGTQTQSCTAQCQWSGSWSGACAGPTAPSCSCSTVGKTGTARPVSNCSGGYCDYSGCTSMPTPWTPPPATTRPPTTKPPTATPKPTTKAPTTRPPTATPKPTTKAPTTAPPKTCSGPSTQDCGCGGNGTQSRTCNTSTGQWSSWGACSVSDGDCSAGETEIRDCTNGSGTQTRTCNAQCKWGLWSLCRNKTTYKMHRIGTSCKPSITSEQCPTSMAVEGKSCSGPFTCCITTNQPNIADCPYGPGSANWVCENWVAQNSTGVMWKCSEN